MNTSNPKDRNRIYPDRGQPLHNPYLPPNKKAVKTYSEHVGYEPLPKVDAPIAAQILYVLGVIGLLVGLAGSVMVLAGSAVIGGSLGGYGSILGLIIIGFTGFGFYLVHEIRLGSLWALSLYSLLVVLLVLATLASIGSKIGTSNTPFFLSSLVLTPLLVTLWTKNRSYFTP